jgi:hypothetical protein
MQKTNNKIKCIVATFAEKKAFELAISRPPQNLTLNGITVLGRTELINL